MTHHYTECGLDYVFLKNGFTLHETPYGKGVSFDNVPKMNEEIAKIIILNKPTLEGQDLKFLRLVTNLSQTMLGKMVGVERDAIAKAESQYHKKLSRPMDKLVRIFALEYIDDQKIRALIDKLGDLDDALDKHKMGMMCVEQGETGWELCVA